MEEMKEGSKIVVRRYCVLKHASVPYESPRSRRLGQVRASWSESRPVAAATVVNRRPSRVSEAARSAPSDLRIGGTRRSGTSVFAKVMSALMLVALVTSALGITITATAANDPSERFLGYNTESAIWTTGNLGKAYSEGDWVSYQLRIDSASKIWGASEFSISYNFYQASSGAIYIDGFDVSTATGFQYSTGNFLTDGTETPSAGWGTHIPTPATGEAAGSGPTITNYMNAYPPGTSDGSPAGSAPSTERYFTVKDLPWGSFTDHVILFYRAHLALDIIWSAGLESALPQQLDGNAFETWTAAWDGASFATGSSRHFFLQYPGIGGKTIPIPIAAYPSTMIDGHKYVGSSLFDGWRIELTGQLTLGSGLPPIPYNPPDVYTGTAPWSTGYFAFTGLVTGSYTVMEEDRAGYLHVDIQLSGDATNIVVDVDSGYASFDLKGGQSETIDFYNNAASTTVTLLSSTSITLGESVTDTATVSGIGGTPTGTVEFYVKMDGGSWTLFSTESLSGGAATSDPYTPMMAGSYYFKAKYLGSAGYEPSESGDNDEPLEVGPATPTVTTLLSATSITLGESVTDTVTVTGLGDGFPVPAGSVDFQVKTPTVDWTTFDTKTLDGSGVATSDSYTPMMAGMYYFRAIFTPSDSNYIGAQSGDNDEPLEVGPATPTVTTLLSATSITLGDSVTDTVTVTGLGDGFPTPTGTVEFYVMMDGGSWTLFSTKTLDGSGIATSDSYTPMVAGSYYFKAVYLGDSNYVSAQSGETDEPLSVGPATPTVTTLLSATSITLGESVTDTVTVTGLGDGFPVPAGSVDFQVKTPTVDWTTFDTKTLDGSGVATSDSYTPMMAGMYYFRAIFTPSDSNYIGAQSGDNDEPLEVGPATPTVTTLLSATSITLGDSVTDTVTVTGLGDGFPTPTGTVEFYVMMDGGSWTLFSTKTLDGSGIATSDSYTPMVAGSYYFKAVYLGDSNYVSAQSGETDEPLEVTGNVSHTVGYWKNHLGEWVGISPNDVFPWTTGRAAGYTYIQILNMNPKGDATIILAQQYIAAKLNKNAFGVPSYIDTALSQAEYWFSHGYPVGTNPPNSDPNRASLIALASQLEMYNRSGET
jgi:hypothetical protein